MKKIFSFFAALLFAGSMMATDVYSIDFKKGQGEWTIDNVTLPSDLTYIWQQNASYGMKASAYNKKAYEAVSWLSSPKIDLSGKKSALLTFSHAVNKGAPTNLEVRVSCEGQGTEKLDISAWPAGTDWNFVEATADLSKFVGKKEVKISFVYTSTTELCPTWEIESLTVSAEEETPIIGGPEYYLVGSEIGWEAKADYKLAKSTEVEGEWTIEYTAKADEGLKVLGVEGETQTWYKDGMGNEYIVSEAGDYTVYFRPAGNPDWSYTYFTLVKKEEPAEVSCADVYSLEKGANVDLNPVTVTYVNGANVYVKDEKGSLLIYLQKNNASWKAGDVLTGVEATLDIYNGLYELKPTQDQINAVTVAAAEAPAPEELTAIPGEADINKYVILKGVSVDAGEFTAASVTNLNAYLGEGTFVLRNNFKLAQKFEEGKTYNIVGAVAVYEKNETRTIQLYFISAEEVVDPSGYFLVGNMTGWAVKADFKLSVFPTTTEEYMIELPLQTTSQFKIVYSADGEATTTWFPSGMGNNYGEHGEITEDGDYIVYFRPKGDGGDDWFYNVIYVAKRAPAEEVDVTITSGLRFYDNVEAKGWWEIYGGDDNFAIELSNVSTTEIAGYYSIEDLDPDYRWIVDLKNPNDTISFVSGGITLAIPVEGTVTVVGQLAGDDGKLYNLNLTYSDPTPETTVAVTISEGELDDSYATYGLYAVYGSAEDGTYVQLAIWAEEGFEGNFTYDDLDFTYVGSGIMVGGAVIQIFSAAIEVIPGDAEGVYLVKADLLCYNNTLYKVTMKIGEDPQGINNVDAAKKAIKALRNGILVIEKNNVQYNVNGAVIR